mmetsp:Transcript_21917/g.51011  ORF Transcript_21917/g.51011 Transcript_21917/m.51011 type:complete len:105 (-) Transcript_21917:258-572(-)
MLVSVSAAPSDANMIASTSMTLVMNAGGFLFDKSRMPAGVQWIPFTSYWYYMTAVCDEAINGRPSVDYSPLGFSANVAISCCFVFAIRFAVYVALKLTPKYNFG